MKLLVCGARYCTGVSKNSGSEFDFGEILVLSEIKKFSSQNFSVVSAVGYEIGKVSCTKDALNDLQMITDLPCELDLKVEPQLINGEITTVVVGLE